MPQVAQTAAGEHVEQAEQGVLGALEEVGQGAGIDPGHGHVHSDAVNGQQKKSPKDLLFQLREPGQIFNAR